MKGYVLKRFLYLIPTLIGASLLIFFLYSLVPGNFIDADPNLTAERKAELYALYGFDQPVLKRYFIWMGNLLQGDLGYSLQFQRPVVEVLGNYLWSSFFVALASLILTWGIALVVGVVSATRQYSLFDSLATVLVFAGMATPSFFLGLILIKFLAVDLGWFPAGGMITTGSNYTGWEYVKDVGQHMILPVLVLTMLGIGGLARYFRTNMLEVIRQDFVRTARAKGLKEKTVVYKHALRNALLPAITLFAFELPALFSGAIITEQIFNWPGIGAIYMQAFTVRDYPLLMGFTMFIALLTVISNLLADLLYGVADPRVRLK
ncbi:ABC transporter permease [Lederbergia galactosidilytica]|uniref:Diguanylate cyclase n=1 Tax=Lederbergia galactosidilytica TaxID=217031 RepID=A0A177ZVU4_9BACI|nr:ABC transporter permease [Lederbergia galactosidilytica]KRG12710.1 diguanylate cyclase [Virgibacillus soli]MBP1916533.1 peptide/nickel transport system permease protein [Lederbergia galactosidilytica]OAK71954.1 diguanylate cyclase [Lederbergia galactosidilytica]